MLSELLPQQKLPKILWISAKHKSIFMQDLYPRILAKHRLIFMQDLYQMMDFFITCCILLDTRRDWKQRQSFLDV